MGFGRKSLISLDEFRFVRSGRPQEAFKSTPKPDELDVRIFTFVLNFAYVSEVSRSMLGRHQGWK